MFKRNRQFKLFICILGYCFSNYAQNPKIDSLKHVIENTPVSTKKVDLYNMLSNEYRFRKAGSLKINAKKAMGMAENLDYKKGLALSMIRMGDYYSDIEDNLRALQIYKEAKLKTQELKDPELIVEALKSIGLHYTTLKNYRESIPTYYEAIEIARENGLLDAEARIRHNLGFLYGNENLHEEAIAEYQISDSLWKKMNNKTLQGATISNLALNAINKGDLDKALPYINESLRILKSNKSPLWYSRAARCKARYYLEKNSIDSALVWIAISDEPLKTVFNPRDKLEIYMLYGSTFLKKGDIPEATMNLDNALRSTTEFNDIRNQVTIYRELALLEEMKGNVAQAYNYSKKSDSIRKIAEIDLKRQNIGLLRAKLDFQNERESLRLRNEFEASRQRKYIIISLSALLVLFLFYLQMSNSNAQKKKLNKRLKENAEILKEKQLTLEDSNKTKDILFSVIGHDLKGPVDSLIGLLDICLEENEKGRKIFKKFGPSLRTKVEHMKFTLENLLSWGKKLVEGQIETKEYVRPKEVVENLLPLYEDRFLTKGITFHNHLSSEQTVFISEEHLMIIIRNLLSNALKFTPKGGLIEIGMNSQVGLDSIYLKDSGVGMDQVMVDKLLMGKSPTSRYGTQFEKGTGLGLLLVLELIEKNGGKLKIMSSPNKGSTFIIELIKE